VNIEQVSAVIFAFKYLFDSANSPNVLSISDIDLVADLSLADLMRLLPFDVLLSSFMPVADFLSDCAVFIMSPDEHVFNGKVD
jgi:hypothetical protein